MSRAGSRQGLQGDIDFAMVDSPKLYVGFACGGIDEMCRLKSASFNRDLQFFVGQRVKVCAPAQASCIHDIGIVRSIDCDSGGGDRLPGFRIGDAALDGAVGRRQMDIDPVQARTLSEHDDRKRIMLRGKDGGACVGVARFFLNDRDSGFPNAGEASRYLPSASVTA